MKTITERTEIATIKLSGNEQLVASLVDDEKLELKMFFKTKSYTGPGRGFRFYLFDENWSKFKELIEKIDKVREKG